MFNKFYHFIGKIIFNGGIITTTLIVFFKPLLFQYYPIINEAFNVIMILLGVLILIYYALHTYKTRKISKIQLAIIIYTACLTVSTILGTHDFGMLARIYGRWLILSFYVELLVIEQRDRFFKILYYLLITLITIQTISTVIFPEGIINADPAGKLYIHFLGNDNNTILTMVLGTLFTVFYSYYRCHRLTFLPICTAVLVNISFLITWPATGLVAAAILDIFLLFIHGHNRHSKIFNMRNYLLLALALFLIIVIFRWQNLFSFIIEDVLHKDLTFSWRTTIWDTCLGYIKNRPFIGHGVQSYIPRYETIGIYHSHCTYLNILLEGGIIGLLAYLNIFCIIWQKLKQHSSNKLTSILSCGFLIYFITSIVEVYHDGQMFQIFLILSYYIDTAIHRCTNIDTELKRHKNKPKIMIVTSGLPLPAIKGGAVETLTEAYLKANEINHRYDFEVYSPYATDVESAASTYQNSKFYYIHSEKFSFFIERCLRGVGRRIFHLPISQPFGQKVADTVIQQCKTNFYDAIIIENNPNLIPPLATNLNSKIILHLHNDDLNSGTRYGKKIYQQCYKVYTVSDYIKRCVETLGKANKATVLMNGINQDALRCPVRTSTRAEIRTHYNITKDDIVFIFSGRICEDKGVYELLQAFIIAQKTNPKIKLLIVGSSFFDGAKPTPYVKNLRNLAQKYRDKIIFTGYIDHSNMGKIYSAADVQVIPSMFDDPCPLAVLEGMAMGLPQIATISGGIPEEITVENAILIQRKHIIDELTEAILKLASHKQLRQKLGQASLERAKKYTEAKYVENFYKLLDRDLQPKGVITK